MFRVELRLNLKFGVFIGEKNFRVQLGLDLKLRTFYKKKGL